MNVEKKVNMYRAFFAMLFNLRGISFSFNLNKFLKLPNNVINRVVGYWGAMKRKQIEEKA